MSTFSTMDVARTGMGFARYWLDTIAHNMANVNTATAPGEEPFRARFVVARALGDQFAPTGSGVAVADVREDASDAPVLFEPGHPLADDQGYVQQAVVDVAGQMSDMILAQRTYQMSTRSVQAGHEAYRSALRIGERR